ncbi:SDR family NAD(P)-dependent oxidoreductase [Pseudonocardia adelaidensis]|uniref:SDR family oxidoreductase n=1 Tax=Pseudonocardia adelaidensis TaxID=648754 RepID=A0ABP9NP96_9PSEU
MDSGPVPYEWASQEEALAGKAALVTGGGTGIGRSTALALAERGADVVVVGRRPDVLEKTAALHPGIQAVAGDVSSPADISRFMRIALDAVGRLDVLVNNAGTLAPTPLGEFDVDTARRIWDTNVLGPTLIAQAALPQLTINCGTIVNVSSSFGHKPAPGVSHYGASKAALEQLTRSWALELAERGIRVNAIAPGPTESEALERSGRTTIEVEQIKDWERAQIPLGRRGEPEDVAHWILALADPAAGWVTGQVIDVDGGFGLA